MAFGGWFDRLKSEVRGAREDGRSLRALSIAAGLNGHYLTHMFRKDTPPTVDNLASICDVLGKDPVEILTGAESDADTARALRLFAGLSPEQQKAVVALMDTMQPPNPQT